MESGAVCEVKSQGEGKSQGLWAAQGPSPQLCHPWKGKLLIQTKDTHIQPMKPKTSCCLHCGVLLFWTPQQFLPKYSQRILQPLQLVVSSCALAYQWCVLGRGAVCPTLLDTQHVQHQLQTKPRALQHLCPSSDSPRSCAKPLVQEEHLFQERLSFWTGLAKNSADPSSCWWASSVPQL